MRPSVLGLLMGLAAASCGNAVSVSDRADPVGGGGGGSEPAAGGRGAGARGGEGGATRCPGGCREPASDEPLVCDRHTATAIGQGRVLIAGACRLGADATAVDAVVYDFWKRRLDPVKLLEPRVFHAALRIADGSVALVGDAPDVEFFWPTTGTTTLGAPLLAARTDPSIVAAAGGGFLVMGGYDDGGVSLASTELVHPATGPVAAAPLHHARSGARAVALGGGGVWIAGGEAVASPAASTSTVAPTEIAACPGCAFTDSVALDAGWGSLGLAIVPATSDALVVAATWSAWWDGRALSAPEPLPCETAWPGAANTPSGRFVAAGVSPYSGELCLLEVVPSAGPRIIATDAGAGGVVTTVTELEDDTVLVISNQAWLLTLPTP